jgi:hypothetical protein
MSEAMQAPIRHHLDRRAADLAAAGAGNPDDLLTTGYISDWLQCSSQWLEIGRSKGYGPRFVRLSPRRVRYRRGDVLIWLTERTFSATTEYVDRAAPRQGRKPGSHLIDGHVVAAEGVEARPVERAAGVEARPRKAADT